MPQETETTPHKLGTTSVSRLWIECGLLCTAGTCAYVQANSELMELLGVKGRAVIGVLGVLSATILAYMNRNAARHSAAKQEEESNG